MIRDGEMPTDAAPLLYIFSDFRVSISMPYIKASMLLQYQGTCKSKLSAWLADPLNMHTLYSIRVPQLFDGTCLLSSMPIRTAKERPKQPSNDLSTC